MKQIFTFLFLFMCVVALKAQQNGVMVCDFDNAYPTAYAFGDMTLTEGTAPDGSLASGTIGVFTVNADNEGGGFIIQLDSPFDPRDFVGISLVAQADAGVTPAFIFKLEQTTQDNSVAQIQDWDYKVRYSGSGDWEPINLSFADEILPALDKKLASDPTFPADQYDEIEINPGAWDHQPYFTISLDNIMLMYSFDDNTGIPLTKVAAFAIVTDNGAIKATGFNGNQVSLKVYSTAGQEIAEGVNSVQIGVKGVYIVKATDGKVTNTQKVVVR